MEKIVTQDVYLHSKYNDSTNFLDDDIPLKMHSNMVVLTKGEACAKIIDAMVVAYRMGICNEPGDSFKTKCGEYLTQLFGEGEIN
jgi:hypothetical protein